MLKIIKTYIWLACAVPLIILNCYGSDPKSKPSGIKPPDLTSFLEGFVVKPVHIENAIAVSGTLKPFEETVLCPEIPGRVVQINLPEGKPVKQGALLVKLFDGDVQATLKKLIAQIQIAEQTKTRQAELLKMSGISQSDYDQTVLQENSINADIEIAKVQIRKTEVRAPYDGVIGLRSISLGAEVSPGTPLATIRAVKDLKLDFSVPEKYSALIKNGTRVKFTVSGSDSGHDASVYATEKGIDQATRNLRVRAVIKNPPPSLTPGSFANVKVALGESAGALMVPTQAIIPKERTRQVIVAKNGKAEFVTVTTGIRQEAFVQVLDGIAPGDTVVTTGLLFIRPGMDLKFFKVTR